MAQIVWQVVGIGRLQKSSKAAGLQRLAHQAQMSRTTLFPGLVLYPWISTG
jgi:hypothetical protein